MDVRFVIVSPARQKNSIAVRLPIVVGRSDEAKFRIQQDSVSRRHCEFFLVDGEVQVRDLGSTNGTLLDGERLEASQPVRVPPGARVQVGGVVFRVEYESAAARPRAERPPEADTVPLPAGGLQPPEAAPAAEAPQDLPPETATATEAETATAAEAAPTAFPEPAAAPPADGSFNFLAAAEDAPAAEPDDKNLDDFFKSLK
jgi:pSer/pThr/pTyr-binding forkhead associated (FHA) protein